MKTTNYENSKKLAEIGFKADCEYSWHKNYNSKITNWRDKDILVGDEFYYNSYDLETILEALPIQLKEIPIYGLPNELLITKNYVGYGVDNGKNISQIRKKDESLADTAARLLILLVEKGIINLKE